MIDNKVLPLVSVVTVVRNGESVIEQTIRSVLNQNYSRIEYIVINGKSTDKTHFIIEKFLGNISKYVNESDRGIYDAMNKGASFATGEWIIFMNAGDTFYDQNSLTSVSELLIQPFDVIFGGAVKVLTDQIETREFVRRPGEIKDLWRQMPSVHQATLVKVQKQQFYKFNTDYPWCADHEMLLRMRKDEAQFVTTDKLICYFDMSGGFQRDPKTFIKERWKLSRGHASLYKRVLYFALEWFSYYVIGTLVTILKKIIPAELRKKWRRVLHR